MSSGLRLLPRLSVILLVLFFGIALHAQTCEPPTIVQYSINPGQVCPGSSVQLDAGDGWMTYLWSNGQTGRYLYLNPTVTATYSVTVQDANACSATASHQVVGGGTGRAGHRRAVHHLPAVPSDRIPFQPPPGGGSWNQVAWTITGGHFDDPVTHTNPTTASGTTVTFIAEGNGPVTLSASAMDANWCWSFPSTVQIAVSSLSVTMNTPLEVCPMGNGIASVAPPPGGGSWSYVSWQIANGSFSGPGGPTNTASGASVYFYADNSGQPVQLVATVQDEQFCQGQVTKTVGIRTIAPPVINAPLEICPMGNGLASVEPPAAGGSWDYVSWEITHGQFNGMYGPSTTTSGTSVYFYGDNSGQPVVLKARTYDGQFCTSEATKTVGMRTIAAPVINAPLEICPMGNGLASVQPPAEGGSWDYVSWTITNGQFNGMNGPSNSASGPTVYFYGNNSSQPIVLTATTYDGQYCTSQSSKTVGIRTIAPPVINAPLEICPMGNGLASVAPPAAGGSWDYVSWTITNGQFSGMNGPSNSASGTSVYFYGNNSSQPIMLTATTYDSQYCTSQSSKTVGIRTIAPPVINAPLEVCPIGSGLASVAPPAAGGNWDYVSWTITNGQFSGMYGPSNSTSGTSVSFYADNSGQPVVLTATTYDNQYCTSQSSKTVGIRTITPPVISAPLAICEATPGTASVAPPAGGGAWSYISWNITGGSFAGNTPYATTENVSFSPDGSGPVTLSVLVYLDGCQASAIRSVTVTPNVVPQISVASPAMCANGTNCATVTNAGAFDSITWSIDSHGWIIGSDSGASVTFGAYDPAVTLTATTTGACGSSSSVTVPVNPLPQATITSDTPIPFCTGTPVTLTASEGASYLWSNGATTRSVTITQGASLSVQITSAAGCTSTAEIVASEYATPSLSIAASGPTQFCAGGSVTLTANTFAYSSLLWSNGATTPSIVVTQPGTYTVTGTYFAGCTQTAAVTVVVDPAPAVTITSPDLALCATGTMRLVANATAGSSLLWSNGSTASEITVADAGDYTVTASKNGCSATATFRRRTASSRRPCR